MKKISILITEDHAMVREIWVKLLNADPELNVIAEAKSTGECLLLLRNCRPDIVLLDINLPGISGIEAITQIKTTLPSVRIIGVSAYMHPSYAKEMMRRGASGYLTKNSSLQELIESIKTVNKGENYICRETKDIFYGLSSGTDTPIFGNISLLTSRELQVIKLITQGLSSAEIAVILKITKNTVEAHRYNIMKKLKVKNTAVLVNFINQNFIDLG